MKLLSAAVPLAALALLGLLAAPAAAQFDLFNWDYTPGGPGSSGYVDADSMGFSGGFEDPPGFFGLLTTSPVSGTVSITLGNYFPWDGNCFAQVPVFSSNGTLTSLGSCPSWGQEFEFPVVAGVPFGFGLKTNQSSWPAVVGFTDFHFTPAQTFAYWTDLGQGMGGALGPPVLAGQGLLYGGMPIVLHVTNAPPHNPVTLVIGISALNAPFKGGVMVPTPNLVIPAGLIGMGKTDFAGTWPSNLPAGVQLWMQFWIVDPTAPLGLSATNAVLAATP